VSEGSTNFNKDAVEAVGLPLQHFDYMSNYAYALVIPPLHPQRAGNSWKNTGAALLETISEMQVHPAVTYLVAAATAYRQENAAAFNQAIDDYRGWLASRFPHEMTKGRAEFYYNDVKAFLHAIIIYIFAFLLAVPVALWAMRLWLDNIVYHVPLHWSVFAAGGLLALLIALATVGLQGLRTAKENPADKLRNE